MIIAGAERANRNSKSQYDQLFTSKQPKQSKYKVDQGKRLNGENGACGKYQRMTRKRVPEHIEPEKSTNAGNGSTERNYPHR
jgi:hypothetical protein